MPRDRPSGVTLRLSKRQLTAVCVVVVLFAFGADLLSWAMARGLLVWGEEANRLRLENERLLANQESLVTRVWKLQLQLTSQERRTQALALVAGLELEDDPLLGLGGEDPEEGPTIDRLTALSSRSSRLSRLLDDVQTRLAAIPSVLPVWGLMTSRYGYRTDPLTGLRAFHRGIDIGTDAERAVYASAAGVVHLAGRKGALGNAVVLAHDGGLTTRYGHLSRITVEAGQQVEPGEIVGYVGRTGRATGYHLHFEVLREGRPVDPLEYIDTNPLGP